MIAIKYNSDNVGSVAVYVGDEQNPSTTTVVGTDGLFVIPDGYTFFKIEATSTGTVLTDEVIVSYSGPLDPFIVVDKDTFSLDRTGERVTTELTLYHYLGETITVKSSNTQFTATLEGTTLSVTAPANNTEGIQYGIITVSVEGGNSIEINVSQTSNTVQEVLLATFTAADIRTNENLGNSANTNLTGLTYTLDGVTLGFEKGTASNAKGAHISYSPLRTYGGAQLRLTSDETVTRVKITSSGSYYASKFVDYTSGEEGNALTSIDGSTTEFEWIGSLTELVLKNTQTTQVQWSEINVYTEK